MTPYTRPCQPLFALYAEDHPAWNGIVPAAANQSWLDHYSEEMRTSVMTRFGIDVLDLLHTDYTRIHGLRFDRIEPAEPGIRKLYIASAGSPCVGKSWELDAEISAVSRDPRYANLLRVDPDRWVMLQMEMYQTLLARGATPEEAYTIARPASNIIANMLLNEGVAHGFHIAHGTTMTGPHAGGLLRTLGRNGYERRIIAVHAPLEARLAMRDHRIETEGFYQVTAEDFTNKSGAFFERLPVYFDRECVDHLIVKWKNDILTPARDVLVLTPTTETIHHGLLRQFAAEYDRAYRAPLLAMNPSAIIPSFTDILAIHSDVPVAMADPFSDLTFK